MTFKYDPYNEPWVVGKDSYLFTNSCSLSFNDPAMLVSSGYAFVHHCEFKESDLKWLLENGLLREVRGPLTGHDYVASTGKKMEFHYWKFTDEALAMDKEFKKPYYRERKGK